MSYILDALRKSEQQRQATQPDKVTDRILVAPIQPKPRPTKWIAALIVSNLIIVGYLVWYFSKKATIATPIATVSKQEPLIIPKATIKPEVPQTEVPTMAKLNPPADQTPPKPETMQVPATSIEELIESKKKVDIERPIKPIPEKKPLPPKKETIAKKKASPLAEQIDEPETQLASPTPKTGTPDLNELTYDVRNNLPNLNINVFSYANHPDDRFVIIDMVKYKTGQLIKGSVKLKEIRPDGIVLQYGNKTFKVERP